MGDRSTYNHHAFAKRHDDDITVLPCALGEPVCGDEQANDGVPFFYFYQVVFKSVGVRLPFSRFERELLTELNAAPAQLYPNNWAFVKAFDILFGFLGCAPSVDIFLHFFEVKRQRNNLWVTLSNFPGRVLLTPFQHSFTGWKGKFFKVCCSNLVPSALDSFPLYWVRETRALKSRPLKRLPLNDQEVCRILAGAGGFDAAALISLEYNAEALEKYICTRDYLKTSRSSPLLDFRMTYLVVPSPACLFWCRFEDKPTTKVTAGPNVQVREQGFIIISGGY